MIIAYIAHPIGGDVQANLEKIKQIGREINLTEPNVVPIAPYFFDLACLDDNNPLERTRGLNNLRVIFETGFFNEVRLYGSHISKGMDAEIRLADKLGIRVVPMTPGTIKDFQKYDY